MSAPRKPQLTELQRRQVEQARVVAAGEAEDIAATSTYKSDAGPYVVALGITQAHLGMMLELIGELTGTEAARTEAQIEAANLAAEDRAIVERSEVSR